MKTRNTAYINVFDKRECLPLDGQCKIITNFTIGYTCPGYCALVYALLHFKCKWYILYFVSVKTIYFQFYIILSWLYNDGVTALF